MQTRGLRRQFTSPYETGGCLSKGFQGGRGREREKGGGTGDQGRKRGAQSATIMGRDLVGGGCGEAKLRVSRRQRIVSGGTGMGVNRGTTNCGGATY